MYRIGNNGADELANRAAKLAGPTTGQGKHYTNRQRLCKFVQQTQATIIEQVQIVEAMPINLSEPQETGPLRIH
eukprot:16431713-Heterocapsa_arctica.AAC.1